MSHRNAGVIFPFSSFLFFFFPSEKVTSCCALTRRPFCVVLFLPSPTFRVRQRSAEAHASLIDSHHIPPCIHPSIHPSFLSSFLSSFLTHLSLTHSLTHSLPHVVGVNWKRTTLESREEAGTTKLFSRKEEKEKKKKRKRKESTAHDRESVRYGSSAGAAVTPDVNVLHGPSSNRER